MRPPSPTSRIVRTLRVVHSGTRLSRTGALCVLTTMRSLTLRSMWTPRISPPSLPGVPTRGRESPLGGVVPAVEDFEDEVARSAAFGVHGFDPRHQDARHRH